MPEQDTDVLEVLVSQVGECGNADPIFSKAFCILPETELVEPVGDLLLSAPAEAAARKAQQFQELT
jgi:hypothetical protein